MVPSPVRVLIVDDDPESRVVLSRTIEGLPSVQVAGTVGTVGLARRRLEEGGIDAVTIDVVLRDESGLDLLSWLRETRSPVVPILVASGSSALARTEVDATLLGAAALVRKPSGPTAQSELSADLGRVLDGIRGRGAPAPDPAVAEHGAEPRDVVAVGASTGGPPVVLGLLKRLPRGFDVPIVVVQHVSALRVHHLVSLLREQSGRHVTPARNGQRLDPGAVVVAGEGRHLLVERHGRALILRQDDGPEEHGCRPAVDPLFRSVAAACGARCVGVVMSGLGSDGAAGALELRRRGAPVVVQDESTSIAWGMPGSVVALSAASAVARADELAGWVRRWTLPCGGA